MKLQIILKLLKSHDYIHKRQLILDNYLMQKMTTAKDRCVQYRDLQSRSRWSAEQDDNSHTFLRADQDDNSHTFLRADQDDNSHTFLRAKQDDNSHTFPWEEQSPSTNKTVSLPPPRSLWNQGLRHSLAASLLCSEAPTMPELFSVCVLLLPSHVPWRQNSLWLFPLTLW